MNKNQKTSTVSKLLKRMTFARPLPFMLEKYLETSETLKIVTNTKRKGETTQLKKKLHSAEIF